MKKSGAPAMRKSSSADMPADRKLELRVGPRVTFLTGDVRAGLTGTPFDIWDDTGLDEPSGGIQFDMDWQPIDLWHFDFGLTWDRYDHSGKTSKPISSTGTGLSLVTGSAVSVDADFYTLEGTVAYDLIKRDGYRLRPYVGGKGYLIDGRQTVTNDGAGGSGVSRTSNSSAGAGTYLVGIDQRYNFTDEFYIGGDIGGSAMESYYLLSGDAYMGYDFNKEWGLRLGYAYDYVDYQNKADTTSAQPLVGAFYVQSVWGF